MHRNNQTTNGTHGPEEDDNCDQDRAGPTAGQDPTVPAEETGSLFSITESYVATSTVPPLDVPSPRADTLSPSGLTAPTTTEGKSSSSNAGATATLVPFAKSTEAEASALGAEVITTMTTGVPTLAPAAAFTGSFPAWDPDIILSGSIPLPTSVGNRRQGI
ncbi:hypothetical protein QFC19_007664 [Naganishia cerealis]|uniref:Uncharacterized protein n=1 Tax=Naganishia cerealis TaxID=610337 RepID=A0ACC2V7Q5_9TREE|nr:hypothetical protein QFC19_007664 [Naganishia cerealis]